MATRSGILHKSCPLSFLPLDERQLDSIIEVNPSENSQTLPLDGANAAILNVLSSRIRFFPITSDYRDNWIFGIPNPNFVLIGIPADVSVKGAYIFININ